ncbi:hypothetical protein ACLMJK_001095 [Lecanora helva]
MTSSKTLIAASKIFASLSLTGTKLTSTYHFDDIPILNPTGPTSPVGVYRTLNFPGFTVGTSLPASLIGLVPQSGTHAAVFNLETELLTLSPVSAITVQNDGSTTKSFALGTFFYGIRVATQESLVGLPASGSIVAKGYNAAGALVAQQYFPYKFTADKQGLTEGKSGPQFTNLYNVTFSLEAKLSVAVVGVLDSVSLYTSTS